MGELADYIRAVRIATKKRQRLFYWINICIALIITVIGVELLINSRHISSWMLIIAVLPIAILLPILVYTFIEWKRASKKVKLLRERWERYE